jgi:hypothetical protein
MQLIELSPQELFTKMMDELTSPSSQTAGKYVFVITALVFHPEKFTIFSVTSVNHGKVIRNLVDFGELAVLGD